LVSLLKVFNPTAISLAEYTYARNDAFDSAGKTAGLVSIAMIAPMNTYEPNQ